MTDTHTDTEALMPWKLANIIHDPDVARWLAARVAVVRAETLAPIEAERDALAAAVSRVRDQAERAARKSYDVNPEDVLAALAAPLRLAAGAGQEADR